MFWPEKLLILVHAAQWFALLWVFMRPRPWPLVLRREIGRVVWANADWVSEQARLMDGRPVDVGTATTHVSPWGELENYWMYATAWAALPLATLVLSQIVEVAAWCQQRGQRSARLRYRDAVRGLAIVLQLPALVTLLRAYDCETYTESFLSVELGEDPDTVYRMGAEPSFRCFSWQHWALMGGCLPAAVLFGIALPWYLGTTASKNTIYGEPRQHERYLRWREAEYELGLGVQWRHAGMWVTSSFRRGMLHPWDRALWAGSQTVLALVLVFLRDYPELQADLYLVVAVLWAIRQWYHPAYRSMTSNLMAWACQWWIVVVAFLTVLRVHGVRTEVTVASRFTDWITRSWQVAVALCGLAILLAVMPDGCLPRFLRDPWPRAVLTDQGDLPRVGAEGLAGLGPTMAEVGPRLFPAGQASIAGLEVAKAAAAKGNDRVAKAVIAATSGAPFKGSTGDLSEGDAYLFGLSLWPGPPRREEPSSNANGPGRSAPGSSAKDEGRPGMGAAQALLADWGVKPEDSLSDGGRSQGGGSATTPVLRSGAVYFGSHGSDGGGSEAETKSGPGLKLGSLLASKAMMQRERRRIQARAVTGSTVGGGVGLKSLVMRSSRRLLDPLGAEGGGQGRGAPGATAFGAGSMGRPGTASGSSTASGSTAIAPRLGSAGTAGGKLDQLGS